LSFTETRDELKMEKIFPQTTVGARLDYENRCLETLETALGRTLIYESWKRLDPDIATARTEVLNG
jgi:hypothetical protein